MMSRGSMELQKLLYRVICCAVGGAKPTDTIWLLTSMTHDTAIKNIQIYFDRLSTHYVFAMCQTDIYIFPMIAHLSGQSWPSPW